MLNNNLPQGLQNTLLKNMSDYGCYYLCICKIAENVTGKDIDIIKYAGYCMEQCWMKEDFTVIRPDLILGNLINERVDVMNVKASDITKCINYKYSVECWYNKRTGFRHFRLPNWDSLKDSVTVREGKIESYRLFTW